MQTLTLVAGWMIVVFVGLLGLVVLWKIVTNEIDLTFLISEENGQASLSRFQFLIFTFVIALSFFLITVHGEAVKFPDVPQGVWALLGISGGSYVISKGIQKSGGGAGSVPGAKGGAGGG
ncbi:MAG: hypothetical protein FVQ81_18275 [Candidatus Glassbacteria bacterium]|nr:hypothetical protein [Candidatus Glassbacteria bacterium]